MQHKEGGGASVGLAGSHMVLADGQETHAIEPHFAAEHQGCFATHSMAS